MIVVLTGEYEKLLVTVHHERIYFLGNDKECKPKLREHLLNFSFHVQLFKM